MVLILNSKVLCLEIYGLDLELHSLVYRSLHFDLELHGLGLEVYALDLELEGIVFRNIWS